MSTGRLRVRIETPDPYSYDQPISVIDGTTLQLVQTATCNEEITLPAGKYLVSAALPSGDRPVGITEVSAGDLSELTLSAVDEPAVETPFAPKPGGLEGLGPTRGDGTAPAGAWHVRFHSRTREGAYEPVDPPVSVVSRSATRAELAVSASGDGLLFAQIAGPNEVPLNVALPIYGPTISQSCRLTIERGVAATTVNVSLPDNPRIDAIARYLQSGHLQEAANIIGDAEQLLQQKMADPFGAALGGYALLRLGQRDRLHHWPRNLANFFPWLPDGAVIAGEESALEGDHALAIEQVCEAGRRGLPLFSAGLSLLASRLREYAGAPRKAFGANGKLVVEAERLLDGVLDVMPFADFDRVSLAFRGGQIGNPGASQTPVSDFGADGWRSVAGM